MPQRFTGSVHVGGVGGPALLCGMKFGGLLSAPSTHSLAGAHEPTGGTDRDQYRCRREAESVPPHRFLEFIEPARRTSNDRLVVQVTLQIGGKAVRSRVTAACDPSRGTSSRSSPSRRGQGGAIWAARFGAREQ